MFVAAAAIFLAIIFLFFTRLVYRADQAFGVTYSHTHAYYLGLDERQTFRNILSDLGVKKIRLPLYWNQIEQVQGAYDWSLIDDLMREAESQNAEVTLVVGYKVPRWPECHVPDWLKSSSDTRLFDASLLAYVKATVDRYKNSPALIRWQVENETFFSFGNCPAASPERLRQEVELVRRLDATHPIQLTVSGEQEPWLDSAALADVLGVSVYRFAWNNVTGAVAFLHPPAWYSLQKLVVSPWVNKLVISELQAEPWLQGTLPNSVDEAYQGFTVDNLREHALFAQRTGFSEAYFWGVEWWYYLKEHGDSRLWDAGRAIFSANK